MTSLYCTVPLQYADGGVRSHIPTAIHDGRALDELATFDKRGFGLLDHHSEVSDWTDHVGADRVNGPEMGRLATELTGANDVVVYPVLPRNPDAAASEPDYAPIEFVHSDFTHDYRGMVTEPDRPYHRFLLTALERHGFTHDKVVNASRLAVIQFWRNTGPVTPDYPLALCDCRDIADDRLLPFVVPEYGGEPLAFETFGFAAPPDGHTDRWYTFPDLRDDEVIVLRTYDSQRADAGQPFWTPHSSFRDPSVRSAIENRRASVEVRVLCIWT